MAGRFWIDIEDSAGVKQGEGPIVTAGAWEHTARLDRAGSISFGMPAVDPKCNHIIAKKIARAHTFYNSYVKEIGAGIIDEISLDLDAAGMMELGVDGDDIMRELSYRQVADLLISDGAGGPDTLAPADIIALAPSGWALDSAEGWTSTYKAVYHQFQGETCMAAFVKIAEITGEHFRLGEGRNLLWMRALDSAKITFLSVTGTFTDGETVMGETSGATGKYRENAIDMANKEMYLELVTGTWQDGETLSNGIGASLTIVKAYNPHTGVRCIQSGEGVALEDNTDVALILGLQKVQDSFDLYTYIYPYGAGSGTGRLTLSTSTWTPPAGYVMNKTSNYIKRTASETTYGQIDRVVGYPDIEDADMLAKIAYQDLFVNSELHPTYDITLAKVDNPLTVGKKVDVIYSRWVDGYHAVNINSDLFILEATTQVDSAGNTRTVQITVNDIGKYPNTDAQLQALADQKANEQYTHG